MFCVIPYGTHTIQVIDFKKDGIYTNEHNTYVPIWNHRIKLKDNGNGTTEYSDEVEIGAAWKTRILSKLGVTSKKELMIRFGDIWGIKL